MIRLARKFIRNRRGATAIEYGLLVGLIAIAISTSLAALGGANGGGWSAMANKAVNAMSTAG